MSSLPSPRQASSCCASTPAGCVAPTSTSSGDCRTRSCRCCSDQNRRHGGARRRGRRPVRARRPGRSSLARLDLRRVSVLPLRPREPLRAGTLHRLRSRRRLRGARRGRRALLLPDSSGLRRRPRGAAPLRRPDRLSLSHGRRRRGPPRPLRLRRLGPHRGPGRAAPGPQGLRLDASRGCRRPGVRPPARRGVGRRLR